MTTRVDRTTLLLTVLLVNTFTAELSAAAISTHSRLVVDTLYLSTPFGGSAAEDFETDGSLSYQNAIPFGTSDVPWPGPVYPVVEGYGTAFAKPDSSDFLGVKAVANTFYPVGSTPWSGSSVTKAFWRDVVYVPNAEYGSAIRIVVEFDGELSVSDNVSSAGFDFMWVGNIFGWNGYGGNQCYAILQRGELFAGGWDFIEFGEANRVHGILHMDIPYDSNYGGYSWVFQAVASASTYSYRSSAVADSMNSVGLTAITDLDGNPITGLSFDSGMVYVPEVPSMYLAPGAGIILFTLARLHSIRKLRV